MDPTTTLQAVQAWPMEDQIEFVFRIWDQLLENGWQPELTDELKAELNRRLAAYQANPGSGRTWEQVLEHIRRPR